MPVKGWRNPTNVERNARIVELYKAGVPCSDIAAEASVSTQLITSVVRAAGVPRTRRPPKRAPIVGGRSPLCDDQLAIFFAAGPGDDAQDLHRLRRSQLRVQDNKRIREREKVRLARPDVKLRTVEQQARYRTSPAGRYSTFVSKVRRKGLVNDLTFEDWIAVTSKPCVYCGSHAFEGTKNGYGVDRVDCTVGYMLKNCVPCCGHCNIMKHQLTVDDFLTHVQKIVAYQVQARAA